MGFFIGWKFFSSDQYYSAEANDERRRLAEDKRRAQQKRAKKIKKKELAKKQAKEASQESYEQSSDDYYSSMNQKYGSGKGNPVGGTSSDFEKFSANQIDSYVNSIEQRYSKFYNSASGEKAGQVRRGFGAAPSQRINRPDGVKHHSPLGRIGESKRVPLGYKGAGAGTKTKNSKQSVSSKGSKGGNAGGSSSLKRSF